MGDWRAHLEYMCEAPHDARTLAVPGRGDDSGPAAPHHGVGHGLDPVWLPPDLLGMSWPADADVSWADLQGMEEDEPWKWGVDCDVDGAQEQGQCADGITPITERQHDPVETAALHNYEVVHNMAPGTATLNQVAQSSAGVSGWADPPMLDRAAAPMSSPDDAPSRLLLPRGKCVATPAPSAPKKQEGATCGPPPHQLKAAQAHHGNHRAHQVVSESCPSFGDAARHPTIAKAQKPTNASGQLPQGSLSDAEPLRTPPLPSRPAMMEFLPTSQDGRPKPAPAWIAGALYYLASHERFAKLTGITLSEGFDAEKRAQFRFQNLGQNGKPIASMLREIMRLAGSEVNLPGWDAVRKHLSGRSNWWKNPCRGGNRNGDFAQVYVECTPGIFNQSKEALLRSRPGLVERAMQNWMDASAQGTLDILATQPPEDPPGSKTRKRVRVNHLQLDGEQTTIKKCKDYDIISAQHQLPRQQPTSYVSNALETASASVCTCMRVPQLV